MVCEVMGRNAGWIALHAGISGGANAILIPQAPFDLDEDGFFDGANPDCVDAWDAAQLDCNDANPDVHPGATEVCNGVDDDCDNEVDEEECDSAPLGDDDDSGPGSGETAQCNCRTDGQSQSPLFFLFLPLVLLALRRRC